MIGESIEQAIHTRVREVCSEGSIPELLPDVVATDNLGEVIEKLVIVHIRMWMLEDNLGTATTDEEIAALKRKTDICFKQKRPRLVEAINKIVDEAILKGKTIQEDSVKLYEGQYKHTDTFSG